MAAYGMYIAVYGNSLWQDLMTVYGSIWQQFMARAYDSLWQHMATVYGNSL